MRHNLIDFLREFVQKRRNSLLLALLICILSVGVILGFRFQGIPRELNKLIITGHEKLKTEEIVRMLEIQPGTSFDTLDLDLLEKKLSRYPRVNSARITKKSEDQLLIELTERKASFIVNSDGHLYEIDSEHRIISKDDVREKDLCVLSGNFPIKNGYIQDASFRDLYNSVEQAFRMYPALKPRISEVLLQEDGEIFFFADEPIQLRIQIGTLLHKDQIRKLYAILAYFEKDKIQSELVDIRGEDAVYH